MKKRKLQQVAPTELFLIFFIVISVISSIDGIPKSCRVEDERGKPPLRSLRSGGIIGAVASGASVSGVRQLTLTKGQGTLGGNPSFCEIKVMNGASRLDSGIQWRSTSGQYNGNLGAPSDNKPGTCLELTDPMNFAQLVLTADSTVTSVEFAGNVMWSWHWALLTSSNQVLRRGKISNTAGETFNMGTTNLKPDNTKFVSYLQPRTPPTHTAASSLCGSNKLATLDSSQDNADAKSLTLESAEFFIGLKRTPSPAWIDGTSYSYNNLAGSPGTAGDYANFRSKDSLWYFDKTTVRGWLCNAQASTPPPTTPTPTTAAPTPSPATGSVSGVRNLVISKGATTLGNQPDFCDNKVFNGGSRIDTGETYTALAGTYTGSLTAPSDSTGGSTCLKLTSSSAFLTLRWSSDQTITSVTFGGSLMTNWHWALTDVSYKVLRRGRINLSTLETFNMGSANLIPDNSKFVSYYRPKNPLAYSSAGTVCGSNKLATIDSGTDNSDVAVLVQDIGEFWFGLKRTPLSWQDGSNYLYNNLASSPGTTSDWAYFKPHDEKWYFNAMSVGGWLCNAPVASTPSPPTPVPPTPIPPTPIPPTPIPPTPIPPTPIPPTPIPPTPIPPTPIPPTPIPPTPIPPTPIPPTPIPPTPIPTTATPSPPGTCQWTFTCHFSSTVLLHNDTAAQCESQQLRYLASPRSESESSSLLSAAQSITSSCRWVTLAGATDDFNRWTWKYAHPGLKDQEFYDHQGGKCEDIQGTRYCNWESGEPNNAGGSQKILVIKKESGSRGTWYDRHVTGGETSSGTCYCCQTANSAVCLPPTTPVPTTPIPPTPIPTTPSPPTPIPPTPSPPTPAPTFLGGVKGIQYIQFVWLGIKTTGLQLADVSIFDETGANIRNLATVQPSTTAGPTEDLTDGDLSTKLDFTPSMFCFVTMKLPAPTRTISSIQVSGRNMKGIKFMLTDEVGRVIRQAALESQNFASEVFTFDSIQSPRENLGSYHFDWFVRLYDFWQPAAARSFCRNVTLMLNRSAEEVRAAAESGDDDPDDYGLGVASVPFEEVQADLERLTAHVAPTWIGLNFSVSSGQYFWDSGRPNVTLVPSNQTSPFTAFSADSAPTSDCPLYSTTGVTGAKWTTTHTALPSLICQLPKPQGLGNVRYVFVQAKSLLDGVQRSANITEVRVLDSNGLNLASKGFRGHGVLPTAWFVGTPTVLTDDPLDGNSSTSAASSSNVGNRYLVVDLGEGESAPVGGEDGMNTPGTDEYLLSNNIVHSIEIERTSRHPEGSQERADEFSNWFITVVDKDMRILASSALQNATVSDTPSLVSWKNISKDSLLEEDFQIYVSWTPVNFSAARGRCHALAQALGDLRAGDLVGANKNGAIFSVDDPRVPIQKLLEASTLTASWIGVMSPRGGIAFYSLPHNASIGGFPPLPDPLSADFNFYQGKIPSLQAIESEGGSASDEVALAVGDRKQTTFSWGNRSGFICSKPLRLMNFTLPEKTRPHGVVESSSPRYFFGRNYDVEVRAPFQTQSNVVCTYYPTNATSLWNQDMEHNNERPPLCSNVGSNFTISPRLNTQVSFFTNANIINAHPQYLSLQIEKSASVDSIEEQGRGRPLGCVLAVKPSCSSSTELYSRLRQEVLELHFQPASIEVILPSGDSAAGGGSDLLPPSVPKKRLSIGESFIITVNVEVLPSSNQGQLIAALTWVSNFTQLQGSSSAEIPSPQFIPSTIIFTNSSAVTQNITVVVPSPLQPHREYYDEGFFQVHFRGNEVKNYYLLTSSPSYNNNRSLSKQDNFFRLGDPIPTRTKSNTFSPSAPIAENRSVSLKEVSTPTATAAADKTSTLREVSTPTATAAADKTSTLNETITDAQVPTLTPAALSKSQANDISTTNDRVFTETPMPPEIDAPPTPAPPAQCPRDLPVVSITSPRSPLVLEEYQITLNKALYIQPSKNDLEVSLDFTVNWNEQRPGELQPLELLERHDGDDDGVISQNSNTKGVLSSAVYFFYLTMEKAENPLGLSFFSKSLFATRGDNSTGAVEKGDNNDDSTPFPRLSVGNSSVFGNDYRRENEKPVDATWARETSFTLAIPKLEGYSTDEDEEFAVWLQPSFFRQDLGCPVTAPVKIASVRIRAVEDPAAAATAAVAVAVTTVAASSSMAVGGAAAAGDAQSLALIALMSCAKPVERKMTQNTRLLSPLATDDTFEGMVIGNVLLLSIVMLLQLTCLVVVKKTNLLPPPHKFGIGQHQRKKKESVVDETGVVVEQKAEKVAEPWCHSYAAAFCRFPALVIIVAVLTQQGTGAAGIKLLSSGETAAEIWWGLVGTILSVGLPLILVFIQLRHVSAWYGRYDHPEGSRFKTFRLLVPQGRWFPGEIRKSYGPLVSGVGRSERLWATQSLWSPTLVLIISSFQPSNAGGCVAQFGVMAAIQFIIGLVYLIFRPHRTLVTSVLAALSSFCLGVVFSASATLADDPISPKARKFTFAAVQAQLGLTMVRVLYMLATVLLERFTTLGHTVTTELWRWVGWRTSQKNQFDNEDDDDLAKYMLEDSLDESRNCAEGGDGARGGDISDEAEEVAGVEPLPLLQASARDEDIPLPPDDDEVLLGGGLGEVETSDDDLERFLDPEENLGNGSLAAKLAKGEKIQDDLDEILKLGKEEEERALLQEQEEEDFDPLAGESLLLTLDEDLAADSILTRRIRRPTTVATSSPPSLRQVQPASPAVPSGSSEDRRNSSPTVDLLDPELLPPPTMLASADPPPPPPNKNDDAPMSAEALEML